MCIGSGSYPDKKIELTFYPMNLESKPVLEEAAQIIKSLRRKGFQALLAGGCVRDLIMKQLPNDFDVATSAKPEEVEALFPDVVPVGKKFGVMLVKMGSHHYEVATFRREGPYADGRHPDWVEFAAAEEDARRRDFTINALFYDPATKKIHDYVHGEKDINEKRICAVGDARKRFAEDHLRMLRAVRFSANLDFQIEADTWAALCEMAPEIKTVSMERIRDELAKMFTRPRAGEGLKTLSECGLLFHILPEVDRMKNVAQPPDFHPEGDVFEHTVIMLNLLDHPSLELAMGVLFHDVAKPDTFDDSTDRIRFNNHAELGAKKTEDIMRRLRFPNKVIEQVKIAVNNHMKFKDIKNMRKGRLRHFITTETFPLELELHRVDCMGSHGMLDNFRLCQQEMAEMAKDELKPKPIVTGSDLLGAGFPPGPAFKKMLQELYERQLEGEIKTKEDGVRLAHRLFS